MRSGWQTWSTAWLAALANRRGFLTQVGLMLVNDLVWLLFWFLVFRRVGDIRGWRFDDVVVLFAVLTTAGGATLGALHNVRQIGPIVLSGELDAVLSLPVRPLPHLLLRRVETLFVGDLVFGLILFAVLGDPTPGRTAAFAYGVVCGTAILVGFLVLAGSLAFFAGRSEAGEMGFHSVLLLSSYPVDIFSGATKLLLYVVVPAGFVTSVPARLVDGFDAPWALGLGLVASAFLCAGWGTFTLGLRRYTSGSLWT